MAEKIAPIAETFATVEMVVRWFTLEHLVFYVVSMYHSVTQLLTHSLTFSLSHSLTLSLPVYKNAQLLFLFHFPAFSLLLFCLLPFLSQSALQESNYAASTICTSLAKLQTYLKYALNYCGINERQYGEQFQ